MKKTIITFITKILIAAALLVTCWQVCLQDEEKPVTSQQQDEYMTETRAYVEADLALLTPGLLERFTAGGGKIYYGQAYEDQFLKKDEKLEETGHSGQTKGLYSADGNYILVRIDQAHPGTVIHEFGHYINHEKATSEAPEFRTVVDDNKWKIDRMMHDVAQYSTSYARDEDHMYNEYFAELYMFYKVYPEELMELPEVYEYMDQVEQMLVEWLN